MYKLFDIKFIKDKPLIRVMFTIVSQIQVEVSWRPMVYSLQFHKQYFFSKQFLKGKKNLITPI